MAITHSKVSAEPDDPDTSLVRPSDWNDDHVFDPFTHADIAAANKDGVAATPSMRTLGTGAQQAAAGNHDHAGVYQASDADLTAIAGLSTNGLIERTGAGTAAIRALGVAASTDVLTRADGDGRYATTSGVLSPSDADPQIMVPPWWPPRDTFTQIILGSTQSHAYYFGRATKAYTTFDVLHRLTSSGSVFTWGELAIAKSTKPTPAGNRSLTVVGYTDTSGTWAAATGNKTTTVAVAGGQSIAVGDHLWIVLAKLSTGSPNFRCVPHADELDLGVVLEGGNVRPSVILGTPTTFNAGQTTRTPVVFAVYPS